MNYSFYKHFSMSIEKINIFRFIVNIITAFQDRSTLYLAMDFMGGGDLRYHLCKNRRFSETIASKKNN